MIRSCQAVYSCQAQYTCTMPTNCASLVSLAAREVSLTLSCGLRLAALHLGDPTSPRRCIAAHGWLDNAASHASGATGAALVRAGWQVLCLDLPGHGRSDHQSGLVVSSAASYALAVLDAADAAGWGSDRILVAGHSMGAGVASMAAGALGTRCAGLLLVEGVGMPPRSEAAAPRALAAAQAARAAAVARRAARGGTSRLHATAEAAAAARVATVARYPGAQRLSLTAARALAARGASEVDGGEMRFTHDPRLLEPNPMLLSHAQSQAFLRAVSAPALLLTGDEGWPWARGEILGRALCLDDLEMHHLRRAGHHLHMDPDAAPAAEAVIADWLFRRAGDLGGGGVAAAASAAPQQQQPAAAWSPQHIFIARTQPLNSPDARAALAPHLAADDARSRVHAFDNVLLFERAAAGVEHSLAWHAMPDHMAGLPALKALRRSGGGDVDVHAGAFLPQGAIDTLPTIDGPPLW